MIFGTGMTVYLRFAPEDCAVLEAWTRTLPVMRVLPADKLHLTLFKNRSIQTYFAAHGEYEAPLLLNLTRARLRLHPIQSGGVAMTISFPAPHLARRSNEIRRLLAQPKRAFHPHVSLCYGAEGVTKQMLRTWTAALPLPALRALGEYALPIQDGWARAI